MANIEKAKKDNILKELTKIVETGQILGITHQELAERYSTRRQTISGYLDKVYASIPAEEIDSTRVKLQVMFDKLFREAQKMLVSADGNREKKEAMDLLLRMMDKFTDFLERFGIKQTAQQNINLQGEITTRSLEIQIIDDRRDVRQVEE